MTLRKLIVIFYATLPTLFLKQCGMIETLVKRFRVRLLLSLVMMLQGFTLLCVNCCCGDSGFKLCSCYIQESGLQITSPDDCPCQARLISTPHKPAPVPEAYTPVNHDQNQTQLSPAEQTPPTAPGEVVLYTGLKAPPPGYLNTLLSQPFLCVFRC